MAEPYSILIADDNDHDVLFLLRGFADIQVPVTHARARDDSSVLELLSSNREFHLVVLDFHLPYRNGGEIIRTLRSRGNLPPIVVLSSSLSPEQSRELRASGARETLEKPSDLVGYAVLAARLISIISNRLPSACSAGAPETPHG